MTQPRHLHRRIAFAWLPKPWRLSTENLFGPRLWRDYLLHREKMAEGYCESGGPHELHWTLQPHEFWDYNVDTGTRHLVGFAMLCPLCHYIQHLDMAGGVVTIGDLVNHYATVNEITQEQAWEDLYEAREVWQLIKSQRRVALDLSWAEEARITFIEQQVSNPAAIYRPLYIC